jgi:aerobic-type carbon monoxide dehydrogenase small subunit (CoxS/CutS family)
MTAGVRRTLRINGEQVEVEADSATTLLTVLRERLRLKGTKPACERGECGSCTVLVGGRPVLSCLLLAAMVDGPVETIEGLLDESEPLRRAFADTGAFQCGFCTPGQIVRGVSLLREGLPDGDRELRRAMSGNICRCTGYVPILAALRAAEARAAQPPRTTPASR